MHKIKKTFLSGFIFNLPFFLFSLAFISCGYNDQDIARNIFLALGKNSVPSSSQKVINISVQGGVVTLTGTVPNYNDSDLAESTAKTVPGVNKVINQLKVVNAVPLNSNLCSFEEAGISFEVPPNWRVAKPFKSGLTASSPNIEMHASLDIEFKIIDEIDAFYQKRKEVLIEKMQRQKEHMANPNDSIKMETSDTGVIDGMEIVTESGTGTNSILKSNFHWSVTLVKAKQPVLISYKYDDDYPDRYKKEIEGIVKSIKRLQNGGNR